MVTIFSSSSIVCSLFIGFYLIKCLANCSIAKSHKHINFKQNTNTNSRKITSKLSESNLKMIFFLVRLSPLQPYSCLRTHSAESLTQYSDFLKFLVQHRFVATITIVDDDVHVCVPICVVSVSVIMDYRIVLCSNNTKK